MNLPGSAFADARNVVYVESEGGHTWLNWRDYLNEFAPKLFG